MERNQEVKNEESKCYCIKNKLTTFCTCTKNGNRTPVHRTKIFRSGKQYTAQ